jgi:glucose-6-phosphate isomerase
MRQPLLTSTTSYQALQSHAQDARQWQMRDLFAQDPQRFERLSSEAAGLFLDYSKNRLDGRTLALLANLARERGVEQLRDAMFNGDKINLTEQRAVLHTALRAPKDKQITVDGQDITADVHGVLARVKTFSDAVRNGEWRGHTGKEITDIVNIGIGGSDLGPKMVCLALRQFAHPRLTMHFVSNVDGHDMDAALSRVDPETTLFIIASKTFTTAETMMNANTARTWFLKNASAQFGEEALAKHFVAVSTNVEAIKKFGIDPNNMFPFWDWVGGRYSVWSAIGLPVALCVGYGYFADFLAGAHALDEHFRTAPIEQNLPMILALVGFWNREFLGCPSVSIAPYHQDLNRFPAYLQQLDMESNGKRVTRAGDTITDYETCPVIWGDVGTNGQHAYFQLLHQGTDVTPIDFIAALRPAHEFQNHHAALLANCFAQSEAFMKGKTADEVRQDLAGQDAAEIERLVPHKTFPGNRPSNTILMEYLTPATLGALIALYEHKTFVQGAIWDVNSFDQWGVELGKVLAKKIEAELNGEAQPAQHDGSTNGLIARAKAAV